MKPTKLYFFTLSFFFLSTDFVFGVEPKAIECVIEMQKKDLWQDWKINNKNIPAQDWMGKRMSGKGKYIYKNKQDRKCTYIGDFVNGEMTGFGHLQCESSGYVGEFLKGKFHGCGSFFGSAASQYSGQFRNGKFHGYGDHVGNELKYPRQSRYRGEFRDGKRHGIGECIWGVTEVTGPCEYKNGDVVK